MGIPTSEVGYTSAITRRETTKSMMDMWWHWIKKNFLVQDTENLVTLEVMLFTVNFNTWLLSGDVQEKYMSRYTEDLEI
jgi:hypothetical protein